MVMLQTFFQSSLRNATKIGQAVGNCDQDWIQVTDIGDAPRHTRVKWYASKLIYQCRLQWNLNNSNCKGPQKNLSYEKFEIWVMLSLCFNQNYELCSPSALTRVMSYALPLVSPELWVLLSLCFNQSYELCSPFGLTRVMSSALPLL